MLNLAAIVGPTAVGKTGASIGTAEILNAEIISCDSMQIYRGMDIGTAKASPEEQGRIVHHLIDIVDPEMYFSVADYQREAQEKIIDINQRGKLPLLVGGTGLWYQAVVDDYDFFPIESQQEVRKKWEEIYTEKGLEYLYQELLKVDKTYALKVGSNDRKRIIRGLEVYDLTGKAFSESQVKNSKKYNLALVGLYLERAELYHRIEVRIDQMIEEGLIEEVAALKEQGYDMSMNSMKALGYQQVYAYLEGLLSYKEMLNEIKRETRHFAKRQYTWFNRDKRITWLDVSDFHNQETLIKKICKVVEGQLLKGVEC